MTQLKAFVLFLYTLAKVDLLYHYLRIGGNMNHHHHHWEYNTVSKLLQL